MFDYEYDHNTTSKSLVPCDPQAVDYYKIYESIWRNMERENALISYRSSWGLVFTGGVLAAQGLIANLLIKIPKQALPLFSAMLVLSIFALIISWGSRKGVRAALEQIDGLRTYYYSFGQFGSNFFENKLLLPRPFGKLSTHRSGHRNASVLPAGLCLCWAFICCLEIEALRRTMASSEWFGEIAPQPQVVVAAHACESHRTDPSRSLELRIPSAVSTSAAPLSKRPAQPTSNRNHHDRHARQQGS